MLLLFLFPLLLRNKKSIPCFRSALSISTVQCRFETCAHHALKNRFRQTGSEKSVDSPWCSTRSFVLVLVCDLEVGPLSRWRCVLQRLMSVGIGERWASKDQRSRERERNRDAGVSIKGFLGKGVAALNTHGFQSTILAASANSCFACCKTSSMSP